MTCYHPLKGFIVGKTPAGKKKLKVVSYDTESILNNNWQPGEPVEYKDFVPIPCGQCIGCRIDYSKQWATRCMLESEYYDDNYFITFTYSDKTVPRSHYIDEQSGEILESLTLRKKDVQDFVKRVRRDLDYYDNGNFRYFCCGEYGTETARPHYHMLAFGLKLTDLKFYKSTDYGNLYTSEFLTEKWNRGHVIVGGVAFESCAYVSRYIMKKQKGKTADVYDKFNIAPEFTVMSRRPGIAKEYFDDNYEDIYPNDKIILSGGKITRPPRYFDNLMDDIDEELMEDIKLKRVDIAETIQEYKDYTTTSDNIEQLEHAERNKQAQIKKLARKL